MPIPLSSSPSAKRMRLYRKRRRRGLRFIRIPLHVTDIDALVIKKLLKDVDRQDPEAIQNAICDLLARVLEDAA
jgi:hypothetical protein